MAVKLAKPESADAAIQTENAKAAILSGLKSSLAWASDSQGKHLQELKEKDMEVIQLRLKLKMTARLGDGKDKEVKLAKLAEKKMQQEVEKISDKLDFEMRMRD